MKAILQVNGIEIEVEVSEEQIEKLTEKKSPFNHTNYGGGYYFIEVDGKIQSRQDSRSDEDFDLNDIANYCTDKDLIQQQAYRETLNRLLWRWQYENDEPCDWRSGAEKFSIYYSYISECFDFDYDVRCKDQGSVYFSTPDKAEQAIEEVVNPFMAEHPDFVW